MAMIFWELQNTLGVMTLDRNNNSKIRRGNAVTVEWNSSADFLCAFRKKLGLSGKACLLEDGVWSRDVAIISWRKWNSLFPHWEFEFLVPALAPCAVWCLYSRIRLKSSQCTNELYFLHSEVSGPHFWHPVSRFCLDGVAADNQVWMPKNQKNPPPCSHRNYPYFSYSWVSVHPIPLSHQKCPLYPGTGS